MNEEIKFNCRLCDLKFDTEEIRNLHAYNIHIVQDEQATLVVTGQTDEKKLDALEKHAASKGVKIIATNLPVLGVFNIKEGKPVESKNGVKPA